MVRDLELQTTWDPDPLREVWPQGRDGAALFERVERLPLELTAAGATGRVLEVAAAEGLRPAAGGWPVCFWPVRRAPPVCRPPGPQLRSAARRVLRRVRRSSRAPPPSPADSCGRLLGPSPLPTVAIVEEHVLFSCFLG